MPIKLNSPEEKILPSIIFHIIGAVIGVISIFSGLLASSYTYREPERYLVSALIMISGGILWLLCSTIPKYQLSQKQYILILTILVLGFTFGLFYIFTFCGGECGGASYCYWYLGYPGYWLKASKCMATSPSPDMWDAYWKIDTPGLIADIVFWVDAGVILSFIWKFIKPKSILAKAEKKQLPL